MRQCALELHELSGLRMLKTEFLRMQKVSIECANAGAQTRILDRVVASTSIRLITNDRMLQPREVHADLVRPPGL